MHYTLSCVFVSCHARPGTFANTTKTAMLGLGLESVCVYNAYGFGLIFFFLLLRLELLLEGYYIWGWNGME